MKNFCDYFKEGLCQSCGLIETDYLEQIKKKEKLLTRSLGKDFDFLPTIQSRTLGFRNKAKMIVTGSLDAPIIGLSGEEDLDKGREILNCPVHHPQINLVLNKLTNFIQIAKLVPYNISNKTGELKGLILFYSEESDEMYLRFVLRSKESLDRIKKQSHLLTGPFPFLQCLSANIQPIPHAIMEGSEEVHLIGKNSIKHLLGDIELNLSPKAFVQTNQNVSQLLYETAGKWIKELSTIKFSELYCGQGAFSFFAAPFVKEALGIEINPDAVETANSLAQRLSLSHLRFISSDAAVVSQILQDFSPDTILVNPPRRGLGSALTLLKEKTYPNLIYSSCSHETLIKDLDELSNYVIKKVQVFDMFPHTDHFETLVLLTGK